MKQADQHIPEQHDGRQTDFSHSLAFENVSEAHHAFMLTAERLLQVSRWHQFAGPGSSTFQLTDENGVPLEMAAKKGDHISIDLPGPGPAAGDGLEWVKIEELLSEGDATATQESLVMIVRPVPDPREDKSEIAHFFSGESTSTFIISRYALKVSAEIHGRNEKPNNSDVSTYDAVRNTAIALTARIGLSGPQWQKLADGLLQNL